MVPISRIFSGFPSSLSLLLVREAFPASQASFSPHDTSWLRRSCILGHAQLWPRIVYHIASPSCYVPLVSVFRHRRTKLPSESLRLEVSTLAALRSVSIDSEKVNAFFPHRLKTSTNMVKSIKMDSQTSKQISSKHKFFFWSLWTKQFVCGGDRQRVQLSGAEVNDRKGTQSAGYVKMQKLRIWSILIISWCKYPTSLLQEKYSAHVPITRQLAAQNCTLYMTNATTKTS